MQLAALGDPRLPKDFPPVVLRGRIERIVSLRGEEEVVFDEQLVELIESRVDLVELRETSYLAPVPSVRNPLIDESSNALAGIFKLAKVRTYSSLQDMGSACRDVVEATTSEIDAHGGSPVHAACVSRSKMPGCSKISYSILQRE